MDAVSGGLKPQPWHHNIIWAPPNPNFKKIGPHLHRYNSVRVHPYAHSQHIMILKSFFIYADICYMTNPHLRYILFLSRRASTGSVTSETKSVTCPVTNTKKFWFWGVSRQGSGHFFNHTLKGSYWELFEWIWVLRVGPGAIWKMAFYLVDPLFFGSKIGKSTGSLWDAFNSACATSLSTLARVMSA